MPVLIKLLDRLSHLILVIFMALVIMLALATSLLRYYMPQADQYRESILNLLSEQTGLHISAEKLDASWQSLRPDLRLNKIVIAKDDDSFQLALDYLQLEINIVKSLFNGRLHIDTLVLDSLDVGLKQHQDGQWFVSAGSDGTAEKKLKFDSLIKYFWSVDSLMMRDVRLTMQPYGKDSVVFPDVSLSLFSWINEKILMLEIVEEKIIRSRLIMQANHQYGDEDFSAKLYWQANQFPLHVFFSALNNLDLADESRVSHEMWLQWENEQLSGSGEFSLDQLLFNQGEKHWRAESAGAEFYVETVDNQYVLAVPFMATNINQQTVRLNKLKVYKGEHIGVQVQELDLAALTEFLHIFQLPPAITELRDDLNPIGVLRNIHFELNEKDIQLEANLDNVTVGAWKGAPALANVSGYVKASKLSGYVQLDGHDFSMTFPKLFHYPMQFAEAKGTVFWHVDDEEIRVGSHNILNLNGAYGQAVGEFQLSLPRKVIDEDDIGRISLVVSLDNAAVEYRKYLIPFTLDKGLLNWLEQNIHQGQIKQGNFIYHGPLSSPADEFKVVQLWLDLEKGELSFAEGFPHVEHLTGQFLLDQTDAVATVDSASILGLPLYDAGVNLKIAENNRIVEVAGRLQDAPSKTVMQFLQLPVMQSFTANALDGWKSQQGTADALVNVTVPLDSIKALSVQVGAILRDVDLNLSKQDLSIRAINGDLKFDLKKGFASKNLTGKLWGEPVSASVKNNTGDSLSFKTRVSSQSLQNWLKLPELGFLSGNMAINGSISWGKERSGIDVQSNLQGMVIELPEPFGKTAKETRAMNLSLPFTGATRELKIASEDGLDLRFLLAEQGIQAGLITFGMMQNDYRDNAIIARGHIYRANAELWIDVVKRYQGFRKVEAQAQKANALSLIVDGIQIRELELFAYKLQNVNFLAKDKVTGWQLGLQSQDIAGSLLMDHNPDVPMLIDIEHIDLHALLANNETLSSAPISLSAADVPDFDVSIKSLIKDSQHYGGGRFSLRSEGDALHFKDISATIYQMQFTALNDKKPCGLVWHMGAEAKTDFSCRLFSKAIDETLADLGLPQLVVSEKFTLDVNNAYWSGSPFEFSTMTSYLPLNISINDGYFADADSSATDALKLISVFNISNLVRRVKLDFNDLTQKGLSFDRVRGRLLADNGIVETQSPLMIYGSASEIRMAGTGDFNQDNLDVEMTLSLPLASNLPWVVALAAGLPAAAGVFIISKVLGKQVNKLSSAVYSVKGPMQEPEIRFERFFDLGSAKQERIDETKSQKQENQ